MLYLVKEKLINSLQHLSWEGKTNVFWVHICVDSTCLQFHKADASLLGIKQLPCITLGQTRQTRDVTCHCATYRSFFPIAGSEVGTVSW